MQVLSDTHLSSTFTPWRETADRIGIRASCALPLVVGEETVGALMIYADESGAFGPDEVAVLSELADDLSYGIGRLRDGDRLARNEALLREAERLAHVGHWEWDLASGRVEFLADEVFTIHGIVASQWPASFEALVALVHPDDRESFRCAIDETLTTGSAELEHRIVRPDGQIRFVRKRTETARGADGTPLRVLGTCQDVTEQEAAKKEIEHSRQFLAAITDNMAEGMMVTDGEGNVTFMNAAAERLLGWEAEDLLGRSAHAAVHFRHADGSPYPVEDCPLLSVWKAGETLMVETTTPSSERTGACSRSPTAPHPLTPTRSTEQSSCSPTSASRPQSVSASSGSSRS